MRITHGNTVLRSLTADDLEMVRSWRNDSDVNAYLLDKEYITVEQQLKWFRELDAERTLYLIAEENGISWGLVYGTEIDSEQRTYWGNIIVGNRNYRDSNFPVKSVIMFMWCFFEELAFDFCYSKVVEENMAALQLNERLGFIDLKNQSGIRIQRSSREDFKSRGDKLVRATLKSIKPTITLTELELGLYRNLE